MGARELQSWHVKKSTEKFTIPCALPLSLSKVFFSCTGSLYPYLENATYLRSGPLELKGVGVDFQIVSFFWDFLKKSKIEKSTDSLVLWLYLKTIFINLLKLVKIFTKKRHFDHFYVAVIINFGKIGFFQIEFSAWRG